MTKVERKAAALSALMMACAPVTASATVLFSDNFDAGTSGSRYVGYGQDNDTGAETPGAFDPSIDDNNGYDFRTDFNFNYGAFTHFYTGAGGSPASRLIPQAPRSAPATPTIGLQVEVNNVTPTGTAVISMYPKLTEYLGGVLPSGDVKLTFDMWMNYNGPFNGGPGSTEFFTAGIHQQGTDVGGAIAVGDPGQNGYAMAIDGEGGNVLFDYRFYSKNTRQGGALGLDQESGYVAIDEGPGQPGPGGAFNAYYEGIFPFLNPDPGPIVDDDDVWYETTGAPGKHWTTFEVIHEDGIVYYYAQPQGAPTRSLLAARTDEHTSSGHAMVGYADFNAGLAGQDAGADHSFAVFDNIVLETVTQTRPKWNVNASGNWSDSGNWLNGVPNSNTATADFTDAISASGKTVTVNSDHTVRAIVFDNAQPYTLAAGGGAINFDSLTTGIFGTIKSKSGSHTINAPINTTRILWTDVSAGSTLAINGVITANDPSRYLKKTGAGTLVLGGTGSSMLGGVRVEGGTLRLGANNALPASAAGLTVSGATSIFDTNGFNTSTGQLALNNGGSAVGSGTLTVDNHLNSSGGGTMATNLHFAPTTGFTGHRELISSTAPLVISGNISGTPKLHQYSTGTDPTIVVSGNKTYTGATAIRGGTMVVASDAPSGAPGALGNSATPIEVGDSTVTVLTAVRAASTANVTGTFNAGSGTFTGGPASLDGVSLVDGDRILLKNQSDASTNGGRAANGIYVRTNSTTWTRVAELDESSEMQYGLQVAITAGTTNIGRKYYLFDGNQMNTAAQIWGQEIANAALLTGGAVTIGRDVNVLDTVNSGTSTLGGNTAHASTFAGNVTLNRATTFTAAAGGTVHFTGNLSANNNTVTKTGAGTVMLKNLRTGTATVSAGTLGITANSTSVGASKVNALTIAAGARFDLKDNKLIVQGASVGTATGGVYGGLQGEVQRARNGGAWDQPGLTTSLPAAATGLTTIGVSTGAKVRNLGPTDTDTFAGQTINAASAIAMYTYAGDANLNGQITGDDYSVIDFNIAIAGAEGYYNGDFNYDGIISGDDYSVIDFNIVAQGAPFSTGGSAAELPAVTAVPEPASACGFALLAAGLLARRRRRRSIVVN